MAREGTSREEEQNREEHSIAMYVKDTRVNCNRPTSVE
jgi:hypothetical protein